MRFGQLHVRVAVFLLSAGSRIVTTPRSSSSPYAVRPSLPVLLRLAACALESLDGMPKPDKKKGKKHAAYTAVKPSPFCKQIGVFTYTT